MYSDVLSPCFNQANDKRFRIKGGIYVNPLKLHIQNN